MACRKMFFKKHNGKIKCALLERKVTTRKFYLPVAWLHTSGKTKQRNQDQPLLQLYCQKKILTICKSARKKGG